MNGYASYVWVAFGVSLLVMALEALWVHARWREAQHNGRRPR